MQKKKYFLYLHILLVLYSVSAVFSKLGSAQPFLSFKFCLFYGIVLFLLALYTVCWQQIIKHLPLTFAYANKAVTVVWGILWGLIIFGEKITAGSSTRTPMSTRLLLAGMFNSSQIVSIHLLPLLPTETMH